MATEPTSRPASESAVGCLRLSQQFCRPWSPKKQKEEFVAVAPVGSATAPLALVGLALPCKQLAVWSPTGGLCKVKKAPEKGFGAAVKTIAVDGLYTGLFLTRHGDTTLQFFLLQHDASDPSRLSAKPLDLSDSLAAALASHDPRLNDKKAAKPTYCVHHTRLSASDMDGPSKRVLVAAMVQDTSTRRCCLVLGDVTALTWRVWPLEGGFVKEPCLLLSSPVQSSLACVSVLRAEVAAPVNRRLAVSAPTVPLALSVMDNVTNAVDDQNASRTEAGDGAVTQYCLLVLESVFAWPTDGDQRREPAPVHRCFQSQCFPPSAVAAGAPACVSLHAESSTKQTISAVLALSHQSSFMVQMTHTVGGQELVSSCHAMPACCRAEAVSATALIVPSCAARPDGTSVFVALTKTRELYACEELGGAMTVSFSGAQDTNRLVIIPDALPEARGTRSKASKTLSHDVTTTNGSDVRLIGFSPGVVACVTSGLCALLSATDTQFDRACPPPLALSATTTATASTPRTSDATVALQECARLLSQLSPASNSTADAQTLSPHELATVLFRDVIPRMGGVGAAQEEARLVQACYQSFLSLARCETEQDWMYLWTLTTILQRFLAHRTHDNTLCYTDRFFLELAERQRLNHTGSRAGTGSGGEQTRRSAELTHEAMRGVLSHELRHAQQAKPQPLPDALQYVLEGLAAGTVPLLSLAEEVVRRYVETSTLSNGACVVKARPGLSSCVHVVGAALVAACLDVPVYIYATVQHTLMWAVTKPDGCTSVLVPPQVYASKQEFERALVMSADLLSIASREETFRLDLVLLILAMTHRDHCVTALLHLYGPFLAAEVSTHVPLADNTQWMQDCLALTARTEPEFLVTSTFAGDPSVSLSSALFSILSEGGTTLHELRFQTLSSVLTEEYSAVAVVLVAFAATSDLVHQQLRASRAASAEFSESHRTELQNAAMVAARTWALVARHLPYTLADLSASYVDSVAASLQEESNQTRRDISAGTTVALRAVVMSFRLTALVLYASELEARLASLAVACVVVPPAPELNEASALIQDLFDALRITLLLGSTQRASPWPCAHIQTLFARCIRAYGRPIASVYPEWAGFFRRLLRAACSDGSDENLHAAKAERAHVDALLVSLSSNSSAGANNRRDDHSFAQAQRCAAQAEAMATQLCSVRDRVSARTAPLLFVFSHAMDPTLPQWPRRIPSAAANQGNDAQEDWVNALWLVENVPDMVARISERALNRIDEAEQVLLSPQQQSAQQKLSPTFLLPMFDSLCRVSPPIRSYAALHQIPEPGKLAAVPQRATEVVPTRPASQTEYANRSEPRHVPLLRFPSPTAAPQPSQEKPSDLAVHDRTTPAVQPRVSTAGVEDAPTNTAEPKVPRVPSQMPAARTTEASRTVAQPAETPEKRAPGSAAVFSPTTVAWWETDNNVSGQTATTFDVSDGSVSSSATSYTTATTASGPAPHAHAKSRSTACKRCGHALCHHHRDGSRRWSEDDSDQLNVRHMSRGKTEKATHANTRRDDRRPRSHAKRCGATQCSDDVRVLGPLGTALAPHEAWRASSERGSPRDVAAPRVQLLQFERQLRPPDAPHARLVHSARADVPALAPASPRSRRESLDLGLLRRTAAQPPASLASPRRAQSARAALATTVVRGAVPPLLTLKTTRAGKERACGGLLDARGLQPPQEPRMAGSGSEALTAARRTSPFLSTATAHLSARYMEPPPVPPSSVFVKPPPLLHLGHGSAAQDRANVQTWATVGGLPGQPSMGTVPYDGRAIGPQAAFLTFDEQGVHEVAAPSPPLAQAVSAPLPAPPQPTSATDTTPAATSGSATLPTPSLPQPVLNPTELTDFRRYTEELMAANRSAGDRLRRDATHALSSSGADNAASPRLDSGATQATAPEADTEGIPTYGRTSSHPLDALKRENDFISQAQKIMTQREKDNERFYERVTESVRSISHAIEQSRHERRGLQPAEQSELLRTSIHQKNELLNLNRQLLDLQLDAARGGDPDRYGEGSSMQPPQFSVTTATAAPDVVVSETQTSPHRPAMRDGSTTMPERAQPEANRGKTMDETFADLRRLNAQLLTMNTSAEAMDKAIHETRDAIKRYEALGSVEKMNAEGLALMHSLQHRTAAVEQRLSALPKPYTGVTAAGAGRGADGTESPSSPSPKRWKASSTVFTPYDTAAATSTGTLPSSAADQADEIGTAPSRRFTSTAVTTADTADANDQLLHGQTGDGERRNTQPHLESQTAPLAREGGASTASGIITAQHEHLCADHRASEDDETLPPMGFTVGGPAANGRAEIISLEALLHPGGAVAAASTPLPDRQRSVTFRDSPAHTTHSGTNRAACAPPIHAGDTDTGRDEERSPSVRSPGEPIRSRQASAVRSSSNSVASPASAPWTQPRIYNVPSDLMNVYRSAPKRPREKVMQGSNLNRRSSVQRTATTTLAPTHAGSPHDLQQNRRESRHSVTSADPSTATRRPSHRTSSSAAVLPADRYSMYAPASSRKTSTRRKVTPARLDARSLATPADPDFGWAPTATTTKQSAKTTSATAIPDQYASRRESRREESITKRIALLEREFHS